MSGPLVDAYSMARKRERNLTGRRRGPLALSGRLNKLSLVLTQTTWLG